MPQDQEKEVDQEDGQNKETEEQPTQETSENKDDDKKENGSKDNSSSSETDFIKLRVVGADQNEVLFKIKVTTQMYKLKNSYSERMGIPVNSLRFLFDGRRISDDETPKQLEMKNGDMLEVYQEQMGGDFGVV